MSCPMHIPSNSDLIAIWERGAGERPVDRALTLLSACFPSEPREELARLSIGTRDVRLLGISSACSVLALDSLRSSPANQPPIATLDP